MTAHKNTSKRPLAVFGAPPVEKEPPVPVLAKGFRPFFFSAAVFAAIYIPYWLIVYTSTALFNAHFSPTLWHAHELIFGFSTAVIAGFLLTAVGNWTGRETAAGWPLLGLVVVWWLGRCCFAGGAPAVLTAVVDGAFLPLLAIVIGRPLVASRNTKNLVMLAMVLGMAAANLAMHAEVLAPGVFAGGQRRGATVALDLVVLMMLVMAARVFPMFTRNATRIDTIASAPLLDRATAAAAIVVVVLDVAGAPARLSGVVALVASALALARTWRWGARFTRRHPLLWVLHLGHGWIVVGLLLRGLSAFGVLTMVSSTHALTVGAIGSLTLGMMARVTRGHTGRQLVASASTAVAFGLMALAAPVRVFFPLLPPFLQASALHLSGVLWVLAWTVFVVEHAPALWRPRVDGAPG